MKTFRSDHSKKSGMEWIREKAKDEVGKLVRVGRCGGLGGTDHLGPYRIMQEM